MRLGKGWGPDKKEDSVELNSKQELLEYLYKLFNIHNKKGIRGGRKCL